jgi:asperthecin polyketide synthase
VSEAEAINETYLRRATRERVDFVSAVGAAAAAGLADETSVWLDVGPHPVCSTFVRNCLDGEDAPAAAAAALPSLRRADDALAAWGGTMAALHRLGLPVAWDEYFSRRGEKSRHRLLHLEPYRWNNKNYWIPYEGTWTLDKADPGAASQRKKASKLDEVSFFTSSVQRVAFEDVGEKTARLTAVSDLWHPDMLGAAAGHKIHGRSVLTAVSTKQGTPVSELVWSCYSSLLFAAEHLGRHLPHRRRTCVQTTCPKRRRGIYGCEGHAGRRGAADQRRRPLASSVYPNRSRAQS